MLCPFVKKIFKKKKRSLASLFSKIKKIKSRFFKIMGTSLKLGAFGHALSLHSFKIMLFKNEGSSCINL